MPFRVLIFCLAFGPGMLFAQPCRPLFDSLNAELARANGLMTQGEMAQGAAIAWDCIPKAQQAGLHAISGRAYHLLAGVAFNTQDIDKARSYARNAFVAYEKAGDMRGMGSAYQIVGVMMLATRQLDSAFYYARESARCYESAGDKDNLALAYTRMGHVFNLKEEYEKATPYYLRSYEISSLDSLSTGFMNANLSLASNYIYRKQFDAALRHALKAYQIAQKRHAFYEKNTALEYLSHIYEQKGDYRRALQYERLFKAARDSVFNEERVRQVKELEVKYETAEKQAAIHLLEKDKVNQQLMLWAGALVLLVLGGGIVLVVRSARRRNEALVLAGEQTERRLMAEQREAGRLAELDVFKSRFFTNISHEFRTPLTVILGMAGQLQSRFGAAAGTDTEVSRAAALIRRNGEHLLRLINQILDLAKLESNTLKLNYLQGDISAFLPYLAESLRSLADDRGVALHAEAPETPVWMDYDPERLRQVVHNLVSNAIKFTPGGGEVRLRITETAPSLKFVVSDTGTGIAPEELPFIFDRFYQASNAERVAAGGSGIGLSLTRELVRAMGGEITVAGEPGKGTAFTVALPIRNHAEIRAEPTLVTTPPERATPPMPSFSENTDELPALLVIEDNPDVAEYLRLCLQGQYQITQAANGREGIEKALETVPDLILSDVMMPEKDGLDVCDALKNDPRTSHIPIVLLTAKADVESRLAGLRRGADAYLAKPVVEEELRITVANLLEIRRKLQEKYRSTDFGLPAAKPETAEAQAPGSVFDLENDFLQKTMALIDENLDDAEFGNAELSRSMLMSESQLHRKIKALTNLSLSVFIRSVRLRRGKSLLQITDMSVSEVAYTVGFTDPAYFSRTFSAEFGIAPTAIRKKEN